MFGCILKATRLPFLVLLTQGGGSLPPNMLLDIAARLYNNMIPEIL